MIALLIVLQLTAARPNVELTPGLTRSISKAQVCGTRWRLDRRHVTPSMKQRVARSYGVAWADRGAYEFDHLGPRQLGGADDVRNLWPQPLGEARAKDLRENHLHREVCAGRLSLAEAQTEMRRWGR